MKIVLYALFALFAGYIILAFTGPETVNVEREITIARSAEMIRPKMSDLHFFNETWNPWVELDPAMKLEYHGQPGKVGHAYAWNGNKEVGSGNTRITALSRDSVTEKMAFGGHDGCTVYVIIKPRGNSAIVSWQMKADIYFFARPFMLFLHMDKKFGEMYGKGLAKLKVAMEEMPVENTLNTPGGS